MISPNLSERHVGWLYDAALIRNVPSPYTPLQVDTYLDKIGWPARVSPAQRVAPDLSSLQRLMYLHLLAFPQDTSALHYTEAHHMPVTPQELYQSMVLDHRGSYCFGQNWLLLGMLRALGYRAYAAAGRVAQPGSAPDAPAYTAAHHLVLLVQPHAAHSTLHRVTYMVDVGFGGTGPIRPLLLADGGSGEKQLAPEECVGGHAGWVWGTYPPERHRLVRGALPGSSLESAPGSDTAPPREWHLQVSHARAASPPEAGARAEWGTLYAFSEGEFFQADVDAGSFAVSHMPGSFFLATVICTRRFPAAADEDADADEEVRAREGAGPGGAPFVGKWTLEGARVARRLGARVVEEMVLAGERERLEVLRDLFGVGVCQEDERWIAGWPSALRSAAPA